MRLETRIRSIRSDDLAGQPSGDETDHQYDQETFTRHVHFRISNCMSKLTNSRWL